MNLFQFSQQLYEINIHGFEGTDDCKAATLEYLINIYQPDSQKRRFHLSKNMRNKLIFKRIYYGLSDKNIFLERIAS